MQHTPKQRHYVRCPALGLLCKRDPRTKKFGEPCVTESEILERSELEISESQKLWKDQSWNWMFFLTLRNPGCYVWHWWPTKFSAIVLLYAFSDS